MSPHRSVQAKAVFLQLYSRGSCILEVGDWHAERGHRRKEEGGEMHRCTCMYGMCSILFRCTFCFEVGGGREKVKMKVQKEGEERREVTCRK